jgi:predicted RNA-binding protein YlxR (DUF448 family)
MIVAERRKEVTRGAYRSGALHENIVAKRHNLVGNAVSNEVT